MGLTGKTPRVRIRKPAAGEISRISGSILEGLSLAKRRELRRHAGLFARLILWGTETCGIDWKPVYAPGEYCGLLAASLSAGTDGKAVNGETALPKASPRNVIRSGELFEKALYSVHPLSKEEHSEFKALIEGVTRA
jgi:hypothetical protein